MEKELLEQILKEIGALNNKVDLLIEENRAEHQQQKKTMELSRG